METKSSRRRQIRACERCRALKVRCDTQRPTCGRCSKTGAGCAFPPEAVPQEEDAMTGDAGQELAFNVLALSPPRQDDDDAFPFTCPAAFGPSQCVQCPTQKRVRIPISCARCRRLKVRCDRSHPCSRCIRAKSACTYSRKEGTPHSSETSDVQFDPATRIAQWNEKFRSDAHWIRLAFEIKESLTSSYAEPLHHHHGRSDHTFPPERPRAVVDYPFGEQDSKPRSVLLSYLPSRGVAEILINRYMETIENTHHFLHIPTFLHEVARFWKKPEEASDSWLAMFTALLYLGCEVSQSVSADADETMTVTSAQLIEASRGFLHRTSFMVYPDLDTIRTLCLIVVAKQTSHMSCEAMDSAWCLTGLITRLGLVLGLHSPTPPRDRPESLQTHMRRILWANIAYLDLRQSFLIGMPLSISPLSMATSPPGNVRYNTIMSLSNEIPVPSAILERTESTFHVLLSHAFPLASKLIDITHNLDQTGAYEMVVNATTEAKHLLKQAASLLRKTQSVGTARSSLHSDDLEAIMFDLLFRGLLLSAHRRFARDELAPILYPVSYWTSLDCALAILVHQRELWEDRGGNSTLTRSFARLFWPDFLSAALTLSSYLLQGDSLDPPGCCASHARTTIQEALISCRDIWLLAKDKNVCHSRSFMLIDRVVAVLNGMDQQLSTGDFWHTP
ncbi:hypothetical protein BJY01DRAFT_252337 [Aspergillus pseudoustus]|uniref:Zn(2)-C6 fungal-type domain-containing protein n=1 Tax=Aspergillus pseudoustus TaxID=1810923 RepID=A0ABR4J711_9EURO